MWFAAPPLAKRAPLLSPALACLQFVSMTELWFRLFNFSRRQFVNNS